MPKLETHPASIICPGDSKRGMCNLTTVCDFEPGVAWSCVPGIHVTCAIDLVCPTVDTAGIDGEPIVDETIP